MADQQQTKTCDACGAAVTFTGHRGYGPAHSNCPKRGQPAIDSDHPGCPSHGSLVWVIGPYSTFRSCSDRFCTAGKRGKPYRFCAPRGSAAGDDTDDDTQPTPATNPNPQPSNTESTMPAKTTSTPTPEASPVKVTPPTPTALDVNLKSLGSLGDAIQSYVDARSTQLASEMIAAALKDAKVGGPSTVEWKVNGQPLAVIEGAHHKALPRLLKLYAAGFRNFLIVGPAGSGKTTLAHNLATALKMRFAAVACTSGMSESALTGKGIPNLTTGGNDFQSTEFIALYEESGVFLLDEVDSSDANVLLVINGALANGSLPLPSRTANPAAKRHADSVILCAANTYGTGADRQYVGRNQLDAAFLDRFVGTTIEVDYDRDLESSLVGDANICARVWTIRDKVMDLKMRRVVGTRFLLSVARLVKGAGETMDEALRACTVGWTTDERSKVGVR